MDTLRTLMRYKAWANELVFAAAAKLPEAELTAPRKIVFGNLLRTLNHVYAQSRSLPVTAAVARCASRDGRLVRPLRRFLVAGG
jgi:hypothetical protein